MVRSATPAWSRTTAGPLPASSWGSIRSSPARSALAPQVGDAVRMFGEPLAQRPSRAPRQPRDRVGDRRHLAAGDRDVGADPPVDLDRRGAIRGPGRVRLLERLLLVGDGPAR